MDVDSRVHVARADASIQTSRSCKVYWGSRGTAPRRMALPSAFISIVMQHIPCEPSARDGCPPTLISVPGFSVSGELVCSAEIETAGTQSNVP